LQVGGAVQLAFDPARALLFGLDNRRLHPLTVHRDMAFHKLVGNVVHV